MLQLAGKSSPEESLELADGDKKKENSILLNEGFPKLGASLMVLLVWFVRGVGTYIYI